MTGLGLLLGALGAAALAVVALVVVAGAGGGMTSGQQAGSANAGAGAPAIDHTRALAATRARAAARAAALAPLDRALTAALVRGGPHVGAEVAGLGSGGMTEFALRARTGRPPASVEKLYTTVSLLERFGPDATLHTDVLGVGHLNRRGTWIGNLYLRGGGDPTFGDATFQRLYEHGAGSSVTDLARQLADHGIRRVSGQVIGDASLFDSARGGMSSGLAADVPDFGGQLSALVYDHGATTGLLSPGAFAARQLTAVMRSARIAARPAPGVGHTPRRARRLASVRSPPMWMLLRLMDVPSDDLFAEMLTKQLGSQFDQGSGTIAGGAGVIAEDIQGFGISPQIVDGSGLSRQDRSSPAEVVALLRALWRTPTGRILVASLPVVGRSGTVSRIAPRSVAAGRCIAKTGTLDFVTNLAGYCRTLRGHDTAFAVFIDGPDNETALGVLSRFVIALVRTG